MKKKQVEDMVDKVLVSCPQTRNSNSRLVIEILNQFGGCGLTTRQQEIICQFPLESLTRARRRLVATGDPKYQADKEVQEYRQEKYEEMKAEYSGINPLLAIKSKRDQEKKEQPVLPF